jgi:hypothetical protein
VPEQTSLSATLLNMGYATGPEKRVQHVQSILRCYNKTTQHRAILALLIIIHNLSQLIRYYAGTGRIMSQV